MNSTPSYSTRHVFTAGDPVPRWVLRVRPNRLQRHLEFAQDVVVRADFPGEKHVGPTVHPAFKPDFQCGPLFWLEYNGTPVECAHFDGGGLVMHMVTLPGEPMAPTAQIIGE